MPRMKGRSSQRKTQIKVQRRLTSQEIGQGIGATGWIAAGPAIVCSRREREIWEWPLIVVAGLAGPRPCYRAARRSCVRAMGCMA